MNLPVKNANIAAAVLGTALIAGLFVFFGIRPQLGKVTSIADKIQENKSREAEIKIEIEKFDDAFKQLREVEDSKAEILAVFPNKEDMVSLIEGLESAVVRSAVVHDLDLTDTAEIPEAQKKAEPIAELMPALQEVEEVPYVLNLEGTYPQLLAFITYLENQPFYVEFKNLKFAAQSIQTENSDALLNTGFATGELGGVLFIKKAEQ